MNRSENVKRNRLFIVLGAIFLTNAILAELIGVKIFSGESTLNLPPAGLKLFGGYTFNFDLTAGVVIWPVVFITTDIINEYFGKTGVRLISFITVGCIIYAFAIIYIVTTLPPADFWQEVNGTDNQGNAFNINYAFRVIFRQGLGIIIGSVIAFMLGQLLDVFVFQRLKRITGDRMIWLRATGSTLISQFIDSFVVLFVAFFLFGNWTALQVVNVGTGNYIYKFVIAIALTPLLYLGHYAIDKYLGKDLSEKMKEEATQKSTGFF